MSYPTPNDSPDKVYTARQAAEFVGIAPKTLIKYAKLGYVSFIKYPGKRASYHFRRGALDYFVGVNTTAANKSAISIRKKAA